jgi:hypothetical protein
MSLKVQEAPQAPSYAASSIQIPANIATPQATMENVKAQQSELNAVNTLSGGRRKRRVTKRGGSKGKKSREYKHRSFIRTYKGRRWQQQQQQQQQKGGSGERIPIPQVGSTCTGGAQCAGAQNATFTALHNQAQSNSINDAYVTQSGGRSSSKRNSRHRHRHSHRHSQHNSLIDTFTHNMKKMMRRVFS